jgi:hypothetical protein
LLTKLVNIGVMMQVALREFQLHPKKYLKELPIELVSREGVVAIVSAPNTVVNKSEEKNVNTPLPERLPDVKPVTTVGDTRLSPQEPVLHVNIDAVTPETTSDGLFEIRMEPFKNTGKCQAPNIACRNLGYKYQISFY